MQPPEPRAYPDAAWFAFLYIIDKQDISKIFISQIKRITFFAFANIFQVCSKSYETQAVTEKTSADYWITHHFIQRPLLLKRLISLENI